jgi:hypothetical protein
VCAIPGACLRRTDGAGGRLYDFAHILPHAVLRSGAVVLARQIGEGIPGFVIEPEVLVGHRGILLGDNSATLWQFPDGLTTRHSHGPPEPLQLGA